MSHSYTVETEAQARERFHAGMEHFNRIGERGFCAYIPLSEDEHGLFVFEVRHDAFPFVFSEEVGSALYEASLIDSPMGKLEYSIRGMPTDVVSGLFGRGIEVETYE